MTWYAGANSTNGGNNTGWVFSAPGAGINYTLSCTKGTYSYTGQTATFTYTAGQTNYTLTCAVGSYAVTGKAATFTYTAGQTNYTLTCAVGSYAVTGKAATFTYTAGQTNYTLTCAVGSYAVTGKNATLTYVNNSQIPVTKGGISKSKVYKNSRKEVEEDISKAISKVTGENKDIVVEVKAVDNGLEAEIRDAEEANISKLQEMVMQAQAMALQAEIDRLIQDELDDEESLMLLL